MTVMHKINISEKEIKEAVAEWVNRQIIATGVTTDYHDYTESNVTIKERRDNNGVPYDFYAEIE